MSKSKQKKARIVHRHAQLMRTFILKGSNPENIWRGTRKDPTLPQIRAMLALHVQGPCRLKEFAALLGISQPAASEMVERLVEMGMVTREQDPSDRRQVILGLTPKAARKVAAHEEHMLERIRGLMDQLEPETVDRWVSVAREITPILEDNH